MTPRPRASSSEPGSTAPPRATSAPHLRAGEHRTPPRTRWSRLGALATWAGLGLGVVGCGPVNYATPEPVIVMDGVELKETTDLFWATRFDAVCIERASGERQCATQIDEYEPGPRLCPRCDSLAWDDPSNILGEPDGRHCYEQTSFMQMNPQGYVRVSFGGEIELHPGDGIAVFTVYHPLASNCPPSPYEVSLLRQGRAEFLCTSDISTVCYVDAG